MVLDKVVEKDLMCAVGTAAGVCHVVDDVRRLIKTKYRNSYIRK